MRLCTSCHGMSGKPAPLMPGFPRKPQDLTDPEYHRRTPDDELLRVLRTGKDRMPAFGGMLNDDDLRNVVAYVRTLARKGE